MLKASLLGTIAGSAVALLCFTGCSTVQPAAAGDAALTGQVSSQEEGPMEGVVVGVRKEGSTIALHVVTDSTGHFHFPQDRLAAGRYSVSVGRATGYELDEDPGVIEIAEEEPSQLELRLRKIEDRLVIAKQLTNAEWMMSAPGPEEQKRGMYACERCHSLYRVLKTTYNVDQWMQVLGRMTYYIGSTPNKPQRRPRPTAAERAQIERHNQVLWARRGLKPPRARGGDEMGGGEGGGDARRRARAEWLATANLGSSPTWPYEFKTLPRATGRGTQVMITEYTLPRPETMVHDAACCDPDGMVWYADFGSQFVGKLDPKTGSVTEYPVPVLKPGYPEGLMDVRFDTAGNVWFGMMAQGGLAKFGRETQKIQAWSLPKEVNGANSQVAMVMPHFAHVDGKVWTNNVGPRTVHRFDVNTEQWETIDPYATFRENSEVQSTYGINADSRNNLYANSRQGGYIGRINAGTLEVEFFRPPTPHAGPRRGRMDLQDRLWVALSDVDKIGMLDPKAEGIREWDVPTPFTQTYDVAADQFGDVWMGGESSDFVYRLDPETSQFTMYPLPKVHVNIRRVDVDSSQGRPVFWAGDDHSPTIYRVEPFD